jgi:hypothetical protein
MAPPRKATLPSGREVDLVARAEEACAAYDAEFPDERQRYGPAGMEWCRHDNQHLLNWAALSLSKILNFEEQLAWLARVLEAREFPLERLARNLELLAAALVTHHPNVPELQERLLQGSAYVRARKTFLT